MWNFFSNLINDETGASAAEYALILAIVGVGIAVAATTLGTNIKNGMNKASSCISGVTVDSQPCPTT